MKLHISPGNMKIGQIPNFSLPPKLACPNHKYCTQPGIKLECYAMKAFRLYPEARKAWSENFDIAKNNTYQFTKQMREFLRNTKKTYFRIHVSGDFFNQSYLNRWMSFAEEFPHINFMAFTKMFDLDYRGRPKNLKIIWSVMPNMPMPKKKGPRAYCGDPEDFPHNKLKIVPCPSIESNHKIKCSDCFRCWYLDKGEASLFPIH